MNVLSMKRWICLNSFPRIQTRFWHCDPAGLYLLTTQTKTSAELHRSSLRSPLSKQVFLTVIADLAVQQSFILFFFLICGIKMRFFPGENYVFNKYLANTYVPSKVKKKKASNT